MANNEAINFYNGKYDEIFVAVKDRMTAELTLEKYNELYRAKYRELYNKYMDENPLKDGEDNKELIDKAMKYAERLKKDVINMCEWKE